MYAAIIVAMGQLMFDLILKLSRHTIHRLSDREIYLQLQIQSRKPSVFLYDKINKIG